MNISQLTTNSVVAFGAAFTMTLASVGCSTSDTPVPGPPGYEDTSAGADGDVAGSDTVSSDSTSAGAVDFFLVLKSGDALKTADSVILSTAQDKYPDDALFQADVSVATTGQADGAEVVLTVAGKEVGKAAVTENKALFERVTIACGTQAAEVKVALASDASVSKSKSVLINCTNGCTAELVAPPACSSKDVDPNTPGLQLTFIIKTTTPDCSHAYLKYVDLSGKAGESEKVPLNGQTQVTVTATLSDKESGITNLTGQITAFVEDQAFPDRPVGSSQQATVKVNTEAPTLTIASPSKDQVNLSDDANGNAADGIQLNLVGTATSMQPLEPVSVKLNGVDVGSVNIAANGTNWQTTVTLDKSQAYKIEVSATNSCGLSGDTTKTVTAFLDKASALIAAPTFSEVLLAKDDQDPGTASVYDTNVIVNLADATGGETVSVYCRPNQLGEAYPSNALASTTYKAGASGVVIPVKLDVGSLTSSVVCKAVVEGPNSSETPEVAFTVALPAPCLSISQPGKGFTTKLSALSVTAVASNLEGAVVEAKVALSGGATFIDNPISKVQGGVLSSTLALQVGTPPTPLPDGEYTLTLSAKDGFGNMASDSACSDVTRNFVIDTKAPTIALTSPALTSIDPATAPDSDPQTLGFQQDMVVSVSGEVGKSEVCLSINGIKLPCETATGASQVTFSKVTLQPGDNAVVVEATDEVGNSASTGNITVNLKSDAPKVSWLKPAGSVAIATDSLAVSLSANDSKTNKPVSGAQVTVLVDGVASGGLTITEGPSGTYNTTVSGLQTGTTSLQVVVKPSGGGPEGVSAKIQVTRKVGLPTVQIESLKNGDQINLSSASCTPGVTDCVSTVVVGTGNAADGSKVTVVADCGGKKEQTEGAVAANKASVTGVVLKHGGSCELVATVVDEANQTVDSAKVTVSVDRVAPQLGQLTPNKVEFKVADDVNQNPADGLQVNLSILAQGIAKDDVVTLEITDDNGAKTSFKSQAHGAASDAAKVQVPFGVVNFPDGNKVLLTFTVSDAAGNTTTKTLQVKVSSNAADVRLGTPTYIEPKACTSSSTCDGGVCVEGKCAVAWSIASTRELSVVTLGLFAGSQLRICSDNPAVSGNGACATPGYNAVGPSVTLTSAGATVAPGVIDGVHVFIAEALPLGADAKQPSNWVSSAASAAGAAVQKRRILQDTVAPTLTSVVPPQAQGVPATCLAAASQVSNDTQPGGTFAFAATVANEDATVAVFSAGAKVGAGDTSNKVGSVAVTLTEGSKTLQAVATDLVGNESTSVTVGTYDVNTVPPSAAFTQPAKAKLTASDSLDIVLTSPDSDVDGQKVELKDQGKTVAVKSFAQGAVTFDHASFKLLSDGAHQLTAELVDTCGNTATVATVPSSIVVDTSAPTVTITSPTVSQVFKDADDASASIAGYQVSIAFSTVDASEWSLELGVNCDDSFKNCSGFSNVGSGNVSNPGGAEPQQLVTIPFGATKNYVVRVAAKDSSGNAGNAERGFKVDLSGCLVTLQGLPSGNIVNTDSCAPSGSDCATAKLPVTVTYIGPCGQVSDVDLLVNGTSIGKAKPANNAAQFTVTLTDGAETTVEGQALAGATLGGSSGSTKLMVDLTRPKVAFISGTVLGATTPAGGAPVTFGVADDQDTTNGGLQFHGLIEVTDTNLDGGQITKVQNILGTTADLKTGTPLPLKLSTSSGKATAELQYISAPDNATIEVQVTAVDAAGNTGFGKLQLTTDSKAPGQITLNPIASTDVNPRRPSVKLNFTAVGADGASKVSATSYEVRYSTKDIANVADFEAACDVGQLPNTVVGTPKAPGTADSLVVEGLDPRAYSDPCAFAPLADNSGGKYFFAVRAVDGAGNKGPVSNAVSTDAIRLRYAKISATLAPYANAVKFSLPRPIGDINGDGKADFMMRGSKAAGQCIFYGAADANGAFADVTVNSATGSNWQCFPVDGVMGSNVASDIDVNGDGVQDLVVDYGNGAGKPREIRVFLGEKGKNISTTPAVRITNVSYNSNLGVKRLTNAGNFNGDTSSSGNAIGDFAFTITPTTTTAYDRVIVVPGNENWSTSSPVVIDVENADARKANKLLTIHRSDSAGTPQFGWYLAGGANWLPDGDGTGQQYDDLVITQYSTSYMVYVVKGRELKGDDVALTISNTLSGGGSGDSTVAAFRPDPVTGGVSPSFPALVHFDGDDKPDLMFTINDGSSQPWIYWMRGKDIADQAGKYSKLDGAAVSGVTGLRSHKFGYAVQTWATAVRNVGNFFDQQGAAATSIAYARPSFSPMKQTSVVVHGPIARQDKGTGTEASYHIADLLIQNVFSPNTQNFGVNDFQGVGDVNGDGHPDLLVGTSGTTYSVLVY